MYGTPWSSSSRKPASKVSAGAGATKSAGALTRVNPFIISRTLSSFVLLETCTDLFFLRLLVFVIGSDLDNEEDVLAAESISEGKLSPPRFIAVILKLHTVSTGIVVRHQVPFTFVPLSKSALPFCI